MGCTTPAALPNHGSPERETSPAVPVNLSSSIREPQINNSVITLNPTLDLKAKAEETRLALNLNRLEQRYGLEHVALLEMLEELQQMAHNSCRYREAEKLARRWLLISRTSYGERHSSTIRALLELARTLCHQRQDTALELYHSAYQLALEALEDKEPLLIECRLHLANAMHIFGRHSEALDMLTPALKMLRRDYSETNFLTISCLCMLADCCIILGLLKRAEKYCQKVLAIEKTSTSQGYSVVPPEALRRTFRFLTSAYIGMADFQKAKHYGAQGLSLHQEALGPDHVETSDMMEKIAALDLKDGNLDFAEALQRKVVAARERVLGPAHEGTASANLQLARILLNKGCYGEAEELATANVKMIKRKLGADHPFVLHSTALLSHIWRAQGRNGPALQLLVKCHRVLGRKYPKHWAMRDVHKTLQIWRVPYEIAAERSRMAEKDLFAQ